MLAFSSSNFAMYRLRPFVFSLRHLLVQRNVSFTSVRQIDQKWREDKSLPQNPNAFGPLTNMPDFTYLDGRPTPLGSNQRKRLLKQQEIAVKIVKLSGELEFAKKRHANLKTEACVDKRRILQNKLNPKGHLILQK